MQNKSKTIIGIIGGHLNNTNPLALELAYKTGKKLAEKGFTIASGGENGIMEYVAKGSKEIGGNTIAITKGNKKEATYINDNIKGCEIYMISDLRLEELPDIIGSLSSFISNDTGILHMAASIGISTIGVYTATNPEVWMPIGWNNCKTFKNEYMDRCPYPKKHCGNCLHYYDLCPVIKERGDSIKPVDISNYLNKEVFVKE